MFPALGLHILGPVMTTIAQKLGVVYIFLHIIDKSSVILIVGNKKILYLKECAKNIVLVVQFHRCLVMLSTANCACFLFKVVCAYRHEACV